MKRRLLNFFVAVDQLLWVLVTLGHASPDETMSAGVWRMEQRGRWQGRVFRPLIDWFFLTITFGRDVDHCLMAYHSEHIRRQLPDHYRN